jgi:hypothetical protein
MKELILYGLKKDEPTWKEEVISTIPKNFPKVIELAIADGFDRFRVQEIDLSIKPDFAGSIAKK